MRKYVILFLCGILTWSLLAGCGAQPQTSTDQLSIVTTIFPEYDWVCQIVGDQAEHTQITMLLDNGVDLHSYQPSADDIIRISGCDLFIYVGGESDEWVEDILKEAVNPNMVVINLMDALGSSVKEEELVEGMEGDHDHEDGETHEDEEEHEEAPEYDEHIWLSLKNAQTLCGVIGDSLAAIDPENAQSYQANAAAYREKLAALDGKYQAAVEAGSRDTLLFGDRFPFRYLVDDYGLNYYAAFAGCSAETEASFETIVFLAGKVDELGLHTILAIEGTDHRIAQTIAGATAGGDQQILTMNSLQSVTSQDVAQGASYLAIMEENLAVLREALK